MTGPVICGVDDSASAAGAAEVARRLAETCGLPLLYVHVLETGDAGEEAEAAVGLLRAAADSSTATGAAWAIEVGHPADRLVALAAERRASFVVVGSHGPRSSLLGSISADVSRRAPCPVVVVPPAASYAAHDALLRESLA